MANKVLALDYAIGPDKHSARPVCVAYGDDLFLRRLVADALRGQVLGDDDAEFSLTRLLGKNAEARDVFDELATVALFGPDRRLVVVDEADDFISRHRNRLEDYVGSASGRNVLLLLVKTFPSNTRLFKKVAQHGLAIECKTPPPAKIIRWLTRQCKQHHQAEIASDAADLLLEFIGPDLGQLDQQLAKLALLAAPSGVIHPELIQDAVVSWRTKSTWDMIDAAAAGNARDALAQVDRLLRAGEHPISILGQMASTFRRFAAATRHIQASERSGRRVSLPDALKQAGFRPFLLSKAQSQLRQLGRVRGDQLSRMMLEADLALKSHSSAPARARLLLEQLIIRLSSEFSPQRQQAAR